MALSGLPHTSLPEENVFGDNPNNEMKPGAEAQLDIEYLMVSERVEYFMVSEWMSGCVEYLMDSKWVSAMRDVE